MGIEILSGDDSQTKTVTNSLQSKIVYIWVNYNDLTATSLEKKVNKGRHPLMALIQISDML